MRSLIFGLVILCFIGCDKKKDTPPGPTPPEDTTSFHDFIDTADTDTCTTFIILGDWGKTSPTLTRCATVMNEVAEYMSADFIVTTGDNFYEWGVDSVTDPLWSVFTTNFNYPHLDIPFYVTVGNHDHAGSIQAQIDFTAWSHRWFFPCNNYYLKLPINNLGDSLDFVFYDSHLYETWPDSLGQQDWLDSLLPTLGEEWQFMACHHPLYSYGTHGNNNSLITKLESKLEANGIDAYISGHDHDMQHIKQPTGNVHYFISGASQRTRVNYGGTNALYAQGSAIGFLVVRVSKNRVEYYFVDDWSDLRYSYVMVK